MDQTDKQRPEPVQRVIDAYSNSPFCVIREGAELYAELADVLSRLDNVRDEYLQLLESAEDGARDMQDEIKEAECVSGGLSDRIDELESSLEVEKEAVDILRDQLATAQEKLSERENEEVDWSLQNDPFRAWYNRYIYDLSGGN